MKPQVSVIVPNYQGKGMFPACIDSLLEQRFKDFEIIFVDDSSTDGSFTLAKKLYRKMKSVRVIRTPNNRGYVGACNFGLKHCNGKFIVVTNNDATFPTNWIGEMYRIVSERPGSIGASLLVQGSRTDRYWDVLLKRKLFNSWTLVGTGVLRNISDEEWKSGLVETFAGGILIVPRDLLGDTIFDESYFAYGEDVQLCWRLRLRGHRAYVNMRARMRHFGSRTRKSDRAFDRRAVFHGTKNTIQNAIAFYGLPTLIKMLPIQAAVQLALLVTRPRQIPLRLKAYGWLIVHLRSILRKRAKHRRARKVSDREILRMVSYRAFDGRLNGRPKLSAAINLIIRCYCLLVRLPCFDLYDRDSAPPPEHI